jgi:GNAT superfamily N-acetyltransferase
MAVVAAALNDLEGRHGFEGISDEIDTSFAEFCLADNPSGLSVAEAGDRIVGFGFSWVAEHLWYLADLFVEPEWQSSGVGRMLLERTLDQARKSNSSVRALITFMCWVSHGKSIIDFRFMTQTSAASFSKTRVEPRPVMFMSHKTAISARSPSDRPRSCARLSRALSILPMSSAARGFPPLFRGHAMGFWPALSEAECA